MTHRRRITLQCQHGRQNRRYQPIPGVATRPGSRRPSPTGPAARRLDDFRRSSPRAAGAAHRHASADARASLHAPEQQRDWRVIDEAAAGPAHRNARPPKPCQDSARAVQRPRPVLVVTDGAGSAAVSEIGSAAVANAMLRLCDTLDFQLALLLDSAGRPAATDARRTALMLVKHAKGVLADLSDQHCRPVGDFRCTLLLQIAGSRHLLWVKVGDGALVIQELEPLIDPGAPVDCKDRTTRVEPGDTDERPTLRTLGSPGKGEFANQTTFIDDRLSIDEVQYGVEPMDRVCGMAVMSDGAAERLVAHDGSRIALRLGEFLQALRHDRLNRADLMRFFHDDGSWQGCSGDDRCLAMAACTRVTATDCA